MDRGAWQVTVPEAAKNWDVTEGLMLTAPDHTVGFPGGSVDKESACNAGDLGSIPELGRSPGEGKGNPLLYSCLGNPMDREAWRAVVHGVSEKSDMT